jgi:hypothetical protein
MCTEMPVIPVDRVVKKNRIIGKMEEERHNGSLKSFFFKILTFGNLDVDVRTYLKIHRAFFLHYLSKHTRMHFILTIISAFSL